MKKYQSLYIEVSLFEQADIVTVSGFAGFDHTFDNPNDAFDEN